VAAVDGLLAWTSVIATSLQRPALVTPGRAAEAGEESGTAGWG